VWNLVTPETIPIEKHHAEPLTTPQKRQKFGLAKRTKIAPAP